uniref:Uncharacterized protein ycf33 n=1 Tax=Plocamium cartilagineum TaxID=31452 RepID=A0A1C9CHZ7_PLOCA|nr:hypothetical protein Plocam_159 [Plocamium cartilagineum]AOM67995.1 hypothetical protein Plocam_159 [Plocamium cartilagineum]
MKNFWDNISKLPRFFLSVFVGFFLTTIYPIFELLKDKNKRFLTTILSLLLLASLYITLKLMLEIN